MMVSVILHSNNHLKVRYYVAYQIPVFFGKSLVDQWLGLHAFTAEGVGSIPGRGTKIPQAVQRSKKKEKKNTSVFLNCDWPSIQDYATTNSILIIHGLTQPVHHFIQDGT